MASDITRNRYGMNICGEQDVKEYCHSNFARASVLSPSDDGKLNVMFTKCAPVSVNQFDASALRCL